MFEKSFPLKGIRRNSVYTIKNFSLDSITSDDNGAYRDSKKVGKYYYVSKIFDNQKPSVSENYNNYVSPDNVYWLERYYRQDKSIIGLRRLAVTAKCASEQEAEPYTCIIHSREDTESDINEDYILPHGNNNNCYSQWPFYKTSKAVLDEQDQLLTSGM